VTIELPVGAEDRAEVVKAILVLAGVLGNKYGEAEGIVALHIALALAERGINLRRGQSNEILSCVRNNVDGIITRLGPSATTGDIVLELALLGAE
jgi:hypothetical protein